jgi:hypothetical protein
MGDGYEKTSFNCLQVSASRAIETEGVEEAGRCSDETRGWTAWKVWKRCRVERKSTNGGLILFTCLVRLPRQP